MGRMNIRRTQPAGESPEVSESSTLAAVNPVIKRLRGVLEELTTFSLRNGSDQTRKLARVMKIVIDEASSEMGEMDEGLATHYLIYMSRIITWCASGDYGALPPEAIPFACKIEGIDPHSLYEVDDNEVVDEHQAIEA